MARYLMAIDSSKCMACHNCFVACKDEHCGFDSLPVSKAQPHMGHAWMRIDERERGDTNKFVRTATVATPCSHCRDPKCKVDGDEAVYTRPDGIVIIDPIKSEGRKDIVDKCPIGAIYWNEDLNIPQKCTMCAHLLDEGYKMPRCVEVCPNGAMCFGDLDDSNSPIHEFINNGKVTQLTPLTGIDTGVIHLNIPSVFLAGSVYLPGDEPCVGAKVSVTNKEGQFSSVETNDFGDWIIEDLVKGDSYDLSIEFDGYSEIKCKLVVENDHDIGELYLEKM